MRIAWDNIRENTLNVNILCKCELILLTFWQCSVQFHKDLLDGRHCMSKLDILVSNYSLCSIKYKNECFKKKKKTKCWRFKDREGTSSLEELKCFVEEVEVELGFGDWVRFLWTEM